MSQGLGHSNERQQTPIGNATPSRNGFQDERVQPGKLPAVRSERGADISFFTQPGPIATYCAALLVGSLTAQSGHQPPGATTGSVENDPTVWTGRALQAESSEWLVLRICIRPLRGADRSWPSWISARVRSHSAIGPRRPVGPPDHERDGETVFHGQPVVQHRSFVHGAGWRLADQLHKQGLSRMRYGRS